MHGCHLHASILLHTGCDSKKERDLSLREQSGDQYISSSTPVKEEDICCPKVKSFCTEGTKF